MTSTPGFEPPGYASPPGSPYPPSAYAGPPLAWPSLGEAPPAKKSAANGIAGVVLVVIATIVWVYGWYRMYVLLRTTVCPNMANCTVPSDPANWPPALTNAAPSLLMFLGAGILFGLVGLIVSIVATARKAGRGWGIAGIILGIVAPIAGLFVGAAIAIG